MTKHRKILNIISEIRNSDESMVSIFTEGSCMNFHMILRAIFPEAEAWYNIDHIITKIDNRFYDITGCVSGKGYQPFTSFYNKRRTSRAYIQMYGRL